MVIDKPDLRCWNVKGLSETHKRHLIGKQINALNFRERQNSDDLLSRRSKEVSSVMGLTR